jgi:NagD protein
MSCIASGSGALPEIRLLGGAEKQRSKQRQRTEEDYMEHMELDFNQKQGFICDMDGVIYLGNRILPGVQEFIQWLQDEKKEYLFLTNNSGHTPRELQQKLARMGLDVPEEHFYTSALATAAFLKEQAPGCSAFVIGEAGLFNALYDAGITMNDVNPDYVVVGEGRTYSLDTLTKATNLVLRGAKLIGANSDVSGTIENGIAPACRALVAPIEMATGTQAYFCGKPNPLMMRTGLRKLGCHSADAVMVGDRMDTDVISGMESGMSTVLVLSGVSTVETLKTYAYRPTMVLSGVGEIMKLARGESK